MKQWSVSHLLLLYQTPCTSHSIYMIWLTVVGKTNLRLNQYLTQFGSDNVNLGNSSLTREQIFPLTYIPLEIGLSKWTGNVPTGYT